MLFRHFNKVNDHVVAVLTQKVTPPSPVDSKPFNRCGIESYVTHNSNIMTNTVIQHFISLGITQVKHFLIIIIFI